MVNLYHKLPRNKMYDTEKLAWAIRGKRGRRTYAEVAAEVGVTDRTISKIEAGRRADTDTLLSITRWLEVPVEEFLSSDVRHTTQPA